MAEPIQGSDGKFYDLALDPDTDYNTLSFIVKPSDLPSAGSIHQGADSNTAAISGQLDHPMTESVHGKTSGDNTAISGPLDHPMMESIHRKAFSDTASEAQRKTFDEFGL